MTATPTVSSLVSEPYLWTMTIGDDWSFPYSYTNPDGSAMDLTGASPQAVLFGKGQIAPVYSMAAGVGVTLVSATQGKVIFTVARTLTASLAADGNAAGYPTRIQVQLLDSLSKLTTFRVDPILVEDPRFQPLVLASA